MSFFILLIHEYLIMVGGLYPTDYEAMSSVCAHFRQKTMKVELKFLYSNIVLVPIEAPKGIQFISVSWPIRRTHE